MRNLNVKMDDFYYLPFAIEVLVQWLLLGVLLFTFQQISVLKSTYKTLGIHLLARGCKERVQTKVGM